MRKTIWLLGAVAAAATAWAADEEIIKTPPELTFQPVTALCNDVYAPYLVDVEGLGPCALIGVVPLDPQDPYYGKALKFVKERVDGKRVMVEVCPKIPRNDKAQTRALIYYLVGEKWINLSVELIKAGLSEVADVPGCHVPTKGWLEYEKEARTARLGMWVNVAEPSPMKSPKPDESDFQ